MAAFVRLGVEKQEKMFSLLFIFPRPLSSFYSSEWPVVSYRIHSSAAPLTVDSGTKCK
jgi:hypothetical protein